MYAHLLLPDPQVFPARLQNEVVSALVTLFWNQSSNADSEEVSSVFSACSSYSFPLTKLLCWSHCGLVVDSMYAHLLLPDPQVFPARLQNEVVSTLVTLFWNHSSNAEDGSEEVSSEFLACSS